MSIIALIEGEVEGEHGRIKKKQAKYIQQIMFLKPGMQQGNQTRRKDTINPKDLIRQYSNELVDRKSFKEPVIPNDM